MKAAIPENEKERLEALRQYHILDTMPEETFDDITHLAAYICGCPIATISIIDEDRQWYKSRVGINVQETSRDISFCSHTILQELPLIVEDTTQDKRFADNPVVLQKPNVRFYAGVPLMNNDGYALGTLCVVDVQPRSLTEDQSIALETLGRHAIAYMELRRIMIERGKADEDKQRSNQLLEQRVEELTAQLKTANESLKA